MDSNRKSINFHKLYSRPLVVPASGVHNAEDFIDRAFLTNPEGVLLHIGVNDISCGAEPQALSDRIVALAIRANENFKCPVYVSGITPLQCFVHEVNLCNELIRKAIQKLHKLTFVDNANINQNHLVDDRHLTTKGPLYRWTGRDLLVENFVKSSLQKSFSLQDIKETYRNRFR